MAQRRGRGEGSIVRRIRDGKPAGWRAAISLGYEDGKRKRIYVYGRTRQEVQEKRQETLRKLARGISPTGRGYTVEPWLNHWLEHIAKPSVRPQTWRRYEQYVRLYLTPALGKRRLTALRPAEVRELMAALPAEMAPRTKAHVRVVFRTALNAAISDGLIERNPASSVKPPAVPRTEMQALQPNEVPAFLEAIKGDRLEALFVLALATGMRQGELLGLRWADVDTEAGTLRVRGALQRVEGEYRLAETKTEQSRRRVDLDELVAVPALREHRKRQAGEQLAARRWHNRLGLVFTTGQGEPLNGSVVTHRLSGLLERAGLPHISFHALRHTYATLSLGLGTDVKVLQEALGHSRRSPPWASTRMPSRLASGSRRLR